MSSTVGVPDRRITVVLVLSGIVVVLIALGTPAVIDTSNTTEEVRDGTELTGCRSSYNATVTDRRTDLDIISSRLRRSNTDTDNAQIAVTLDALFNDGDNLPVLINKLEAAGDREIELTADVETAEQALVEANDHYQAAIDLSRSDPETFLTECNKENL